MAEHVPNEQPALDSALVSREDRLLAALAHGSVIAQGLGLIVGVVIYFNRREKSPQAAFQALQAALYQLVTLIIVIGSWMLWTLFYFLSLIPVIQAAETAPDAAPPPIFWIGLGSMGIPLILMIVLWVPGFWAAIRTLQGKPYRYPVIGGWVESFMQNGS